MFKSITVPEERACDANCYIEGNCVSYNIVSSTEDGTLTCELNDSDDEMHPVDLKRRFGYIYQPFKVRFTRVRVLSIWQTAQFVSHFEEALLQFLIKCALSKWHTTMALQGILSFEISRFSPIQWQMESVQEIICK